MAAAHPRIALNGPHAPNTAETLCANPAPPQIIAVARADIAGCSMYHARIRLGHILTGWTGTGAKATETLELVRIEQLDQKALAAIRAKALQLEQSAFRRSKDVYAKSKAVTR